MIIAIVIAVVVEVVGWNQRLYYTLILTMLSLEIASVVIIANQPRRAFAALMSAPATASAAGAGVV